MDKIYEKRERTLKEKYGDKLPELRTKWAKNAASKVKKPRGLAAMSEEKKWVIINKATLKRKEQAELLKRLKEGR